MGGELNNEDESPGDSPEAAASLRPEAGGTDARQGSRKRIGATLADVARAAGVSTATASRALNLPNLLSKEALARVHAAIAETGYIPSLTTGTIITNRSRLVAIMLPPMPMELFDGTIRAAVADLDAAGYQTLLGIYNRDSTREQIVTQILSRRPSGLILIGMPVLPGIRELLVETGLPIVETWELPRNPIDMVAGISHENIGIAVGNFVVRKGYRRPMIFSTTGRGVIRRYWISQVLMEAGYDEPPHLDVALPGTIGEGRRMLARVIEEGGRPDVILCGSDWLAHGVLVEAGVRGIKVPEEIAVVGFGDFEFAKDIEPALTTIRIDRGEMGRRAAELLLDALEGREPPQRILDVGFTLVERAST